MSERGDHLVLGTRKGTIFLDRTASGWNVTNVAHRGIPVAYAARDPRTGCLWSCLDHGHWGQKLSRSSDGGATWDDVPSPAYPEGEVIRDEVPATLKYLWVFQPGGDDQEGRVYLGTEPGGLFRSDDNGDTWSLNESLWGHPSRKEAWFGGGRDTPGIHSIVVDPRDSRRIFIGISCAGIFESTDDGATWTVRNGGLESSFLPDPSAEVGHDPHFLAQCAARPDTIWQQNHVGIYKSDDAGRSWQALSKPGDFPHFGFAVAADAADADRAWVVPSLSDDSRVLDGDALSVCRTRDGGRTWTRLTEGLPQQHAFDITYRHALDAAGERVAFGTTSGNAYVSEDGGDSWTSLGTNFPLVYSVRFV